MSARVSQESGFTLIEVLVAAALLALVLGAALSLSDTGGQIAEKDLERAHAIDDAQAAIAQMDRDLRTATQVISPAPGVASNSVDFIAPKRPTGTGSRVAERIVYRCDSPSPTKPSLRACYRYVGPPSSPPGGAGMLVLDQLTNGTSAAPVFRPSANGRYFAVQVARSAAGSRKGGYGFSVTLNHGIYLRNLDGAL